jgi:hypothetical protein
MRKHIIWILAFLLLAFVGDRLIGHFLKNITESSQFRYSRLYFSTEDADILFVGNSRGLTFYQPEVELLTGKKTMNLSYNGMPADLAKCLVMDYLDHHTPPKTMIVDITLCDRENEVLKSGMNSYVPYSQRLTDLIKNTVSTKVITADPLVIDTLDILAGKKVFYGGQFSQLYRYNSEIFQRVLFHKNKTDKDQLIDRTIGESASTDTSIKSYKVRMFPNMVKELKEMVDYAKAKGVDVKLVINPYFPAFAETIRDSFLTPLKTHVEAQTNMHVSDYSTILTAREEIGDYQHANKKGSIRFMQILMAHGFFTPNNGANMGINGLSQDNEMPLSSKKSPEAAHSSTLLATNFTPSVSVTQKGKTLVELDAKQVLNEVKIEELAAKKTKKEKKKESEWIAVDTMFNEH